MTSRADLGFGSVDVDLARRWLHLSSDEDRPIWMVNLMKYRPRAVYDGGEAEISGKEADDRYAPVEVLADLGAVVAFHGDVLDQSSGEPAFDRVGIVRYPTRASFLAMQNRDDFKKKYVHKEAGMAFTIIAACLPRTNEAPTAPAAGSSLLMRLRRLHVGVPAGDASGLVPSLSFDVEGTIVGDERPWDEFLVDWATPDALASYAPGPEVAEEIAMVVDRAIDRLAGSVESSPPWR